MRLTFSLKSYYILEFNLNQYEQLLDIHKIIFTKRTSVNTFCLFRNYVDNFIE